MQKNCRQLIMLFTVLMMVSGGVLASTATKCVQIYYQSVSSDKDRPGHGLLLAIYLENLIAHFKDIQQYVIPIDLYHMGGLNHCAASFYIGSDYNAKVPFSFLYDYKKTDKQVVWIQYGMRSLPIKYQESVWGGHVLSTSEVEGDLNYFSYKGERFRYDSSFELKKSQGIVPVKLVSKKVRVYSSAYFKGGKKPAILPAILRNNNHWYVAVNPFMDMAQNSPYMIFADVLFDILDEKPQEKQRLAFVRVEDISPITKPETIYQYTDFFKKHDVPFAISLIPFYYDPLRTYHDRRFHGKALTDFPHLSKSLHYAKRNGGSFIWHGVNHQVGNMKNPFNGVTGSDYEFWDAVNKKPIDSQTVRYLLGLLKKGKSIFSDLNLHPSAWITPHYHASPLANSVFGEVFPWQVGRVYYAPAAICGQKALPPELSFLVKQETYSANLQRMKYFENLRVLPLGYYPRGNQMFPYSIYGDFYGSILIPETLGNIQPYMSNQVKSTISVDDLLDTAKRNLVLRDVWASFFVHEVLLNSKDNNGLAKFRGDMSEMSRLIRKLKEMGYQFVDLEKHIQQQRHHKRPPTIYVSHKSHCNEANHQGKN